MTVQLMLDILGWVGSFIILYAFYLLNRQKFTANSVAYQWMNLLGSLLLGLNSLYYKAYPSVSINCMWILITIYGLIKIQERRKAEMNSNLFKD